MVNPRDKAGNTEEEEDDFLKGGITEMTFWSEA